MKILIVIDCPSRDGTVMMGAAGLELSRIFSEIGVDRNDLSFKALLPEYRQNLSSLLKRNKTASDSRLVNGNYISETSLEIQSNFLSSFNHKDWDLIIPMGNLPLFVFTNEISTTAFRGSQLSYKTCRLLPTYTISEVFRRWELRKIVQADLYRAIFGDWTQPFKKWTINPTYANAITALNKILYRLEYENGLLISCDIETFHNTISVIGLATSSSVCLVINFIDFQSPPLYSTYTIEEELEIIRKLKKILTHKNAYITGQNFNFDRQYIIKQWGFIPRHDHDSEYLWHILYPGDYPKNLAFISSMTVTNYVYWKDEGKKFHDSTKSPKDLQLYLEYNAKDCCYTYEATTTLLTAVEESNLLEPYNFQMKMSNPILYTMCNGTNYDYQLQQKERFRLLSVMQSFEAFFEYIIPSSKWWKMNKNSALWCRSPTKIAYFLYTLLALPVQRDKKTKNPTTNDKALKQLMKHEPILKPLLTALLKYRSIGVFSSTFLNMPIDNDKRMRTNYSLDGTETFRLSSRETPFNTGGNLQNIPKGDE